MSEDNYPEIWVNTPDDAPPTDDAYEWKTRKLCECGSLITQDELANTLRDLEWLCRGLGTDGIASSLLAEYDIRTKSEGNNTNG